MTLTSGGTSVTIPLRGVVSGNDRSGYSIHIQLSGQRGDIPAMPDCSIIGSRNSRPREG